MVMDLHTSRFQNCFKSVIEKRVGANHALLTRRDLNLVAYRVFINNYTCWTRTEVSEVSCSHC